MHHDEPFCFSVEAVTKPKSEIVEEDPNNNKIGFSVSLNP